HHPWVVRIIAPMGGQVEGYRKPLVSRFQISPVKGIAFLGRGKACILSDGPGSAHIHSGVGTPKIGGQACGPGLGLPLGELFGTVRWDQFQMLEIFSTHGPIFFVPWLPPTFWPKWARSGSVACAPLQRGAAAVPPSSGPGGSGMRWCPTGRVRPNRRAIVP